MRYRKSHRIEHLRCAIASVGLAIGSALVVLSVINLPASAQDRAHDRFNSCMNAGDFAKGRPETPVQFCRGWAPCPDCPTLSGLPPGSWRQSCQAEALDGNTLTASCRDSAGSTRPVASSIDFSTCGGHKVQNRDGQLTCE
jgi:hypothetical protein